MKPKMTYMIYESYCSMCGDTIQDRNTYRGHRCINCRGKKNRPNYLFNKEGICTTNMALKK